MIINNHAGVTRMQFIFISLCFLVIIIWKVEKALRRINPINEWKETGSLENNYDRNFSIGLNGSNGKTN